jgi:hypothetical protein
MATTHPPYRCILYTYLTSRAIRVPPPKRFIYWHSTLFWFIITKISIHPPIYLYLSTYLPIYLYVYKCIYFLHFKIKVMFGQKLRYEIKVTCGEISLKLRQTNENVAKNNVSVVADEIPSQITIYTCLIIDLWTRRHWRTSTWFCALWCHQPKMAGFQWNWH